MNQDYPILKTPEFDEQKTTEAAAILLRESGGRMGPMRLLKLLYLADRRAWEEWERPITFDRYSSMQLGPILSTTYNIIRKRAPGRGAIWSEFIERVNRYNLVLRGMPQLKRLSRGEIDLLIETVARYRQMDDKELSRYTHTLPEYEDPGESSLPIHLVSLFNALQFTEGDVSRIARELQEEAELDTILRE